VIFSGVHDLKVIYSWIIIQKHASTMNLYVLVSHFGHLSAFVWAMLILGCFVMRCYPIFLDFLLVSRYSPIPVMGDNVVDMSQGLRNCEHVFSLLLS
jgi:hypothetical protein